jgi:hypothetical protein
MGSLAFARASLMSGKTKLLPQPQSVKDVPHFCDLAICDAKYVDTRIGHSLAGWGQTVRFAQMHITSFPYQNENMILG